MHSTKLCSLGLATGPLKLSGPHARGSTARIITCSAKSIFGKSLPQSGAKASIGLSGPTQPKTSMLDPETLEQHGPSDLRPCMQIYDWKKFSWQLFPGLVSFSKAAKRWHSNSSNMGCRCTQAHCARSESIRSRWRGLRIATHLGRRWWHSSSVGIKRRRRW